MQWLTNSRMRVDLKLIGDRYSIITLIFFIPYVLFQPPAVVVLRKLGPKNFLAFITVAWGATMIVSQQTKPQVNGANLSRALGL